MKKVILASANKNKCKELNILLNNYMTLIPQSDLSINSVEETGLSFVENALIKARSASIKTNNPALADDSGLIVHSLMGSPGIYSSRYAGKVATDNDNNNLLLKNLLNCKPEQRKASFICVLVYIRHHKDPLPIIALGKVDGEILTKSVGNNGFGYDSIFYIPSIKKSFAELSEAEKNNISHRQMAIKNLKIALNNNL